MRPPVNVITPTVPPVVPGPKAYMPPYTASPVVNLFGVEQPTILPPFMVNEPPERNSPPPLLAMQPTILPPFIVNVPFPMFTPPPSTPLEKKIRLPVPPVMTPPLTVSVPLSSSTHGSTPLTLNLCSAVGSLSMRVRSPVVVLFLSAWRIMTLPLPVIFRT